MISYNVGRGWTAEWENEDAENPVNYADQFNDVPQEVLEGYPGNPMDVGTCIDDARVMTDDTALIALASHWHTDVRIALT